jgi:hypothetical protein
MRLFLYVKPQEANSLRLSSQQITLFPSSIWAQSISPENTPDNYEAIAHTYSLVLLFSRAKVIMLQRFYAFALYFWSGSLL